MPSEITRSLVALCLFGALVAEAALRSLERQHIDPKWDAFCLDGTPAYYYWSGAPHGGDTLKTIIVLGGGDWCANASECEALSRTPEGSSTTWNDTMFQTGILDTDPTLNEFAGWNVAFLMSCDGSSFISNQANPVGAENLLMRGGSTLEGFMDALLTQHELATQHQVLVAGYGTGGLAVYIHLDDIRKMIPHAVIVGGLADSGFFLAEPNEKFYNRLLAMVDYSNGTRWLNQLCVASHAHAESSSCVWPQVNYYFVRTPLFVVQDQYDRWQLENSDGVTCLPPATNCSQNQTNAFRQFRLDMMKALHACGVDTEPTGGLFAASCIGYQHMLSTDWFDGSWSIDGVTVAHAVANWVLGTTKWTEWKHYDSCEYPCNVPCAERPQPPRVGNFPILWKRPATEPAIVAQDRQ